MSMLITTITRNEVDLEVEVLYKYFAAIRSSNIEEPDEEDFAEVESVTVIASGEEITTTLTPAEMKSIEEVVWEDVCGDV